MLTKLTVQSSHWIKSLVLAGLCSLAMGPAGHAADSLVSHDASAVALAQGNAEETSEVSTVGFFDLFHKKSSCDAACDTFTDSCCDGCGHQECCCCPPWWAHRKGAFAQFMLLRPGNIDHIYTIEQNDTVPGAFPTGPVGRVNIDEEPAYRLGFSCCLSQCSSIVASWMKFEGSTSDQITRTGNNVLNSQIIHPSTETTGSSSLQSAADYSLDFQLVDVAYRRIWRHNDCYAINWFAGFRYANMEQDLLHQQQVSTATGLVTVDTDVDFNGFGSMIGLDLERHKACSPFFAYAKGATSFLAGDWEASYRQTNQFGGGVVGNNYEDYRITPIMEFELGVGMQSKCGRCRGTIGYMTSAWYNAISTREYVDAVRATDYTSVDNSITFNGLTAQIELRL